MEKIMLSDNDSIKFREFLKTKMETGKHEIVFEKVDGTIRVLRGTRDPALIEKEIYEKFMNPPPRKDGKARVQSLTSLPTYDLEIHSWRSFSFETLVSIDGINTNELLKQANINLG